MFENNIPSIIWSIKRICNENILSIYFIINCVQNTIERLSCRHRTNWKSKYIRRQAATSLGIHHKGCVVDMRAKIPAENEFMFYYLKVQIKIILTYSRDLFSCFIDNFFQTNSFVKHKKLLFHTTFICNY